MRETWREAVLSGFHHALQARHSAFHHVTKETRRWNWRASVAPNLFFFIEAITHNNMEQFVIELAWSEESEFPFSGVPVLPELIKISSPIGRIRLTRFWTTHGLEPSWDLCPERTKFFSEHIPTSQFVPAPTVPLEEISTRLPPLIDDAIEKFEQYGIPMFRRVAAAHGIVAPLEI